MNYSDETGRELLPRYSFVDRLSGVLKHISHVMTDATRPNFEIKITKKSPDKFRVEVGEIKK